MLLEEAIEFYETADTDNSRDTGRLQATVKERDFVVAIAEYVPGDPGSIALDLYGAKHFIAWMEKARECAKEGDRSAYQCIIDIEA